MPLIDWLAALLVISLWGINFVIIKVGLNDFPPLLLGALRFATVAFPAIFFIKRPQIPLKLLLTYGLAISFGQFAFLFTALYFGMPAGLSSLLLQAQAFFTVLLAAFILGEQIHAHNLIAIAIALMGLLVIYYGGDTGQSVPMIGLTLTLMAAFSWAIGNIAIKQAKNVNMLSLVAWGALVPILPFLLCSLLFEGSDLIMLSIKNASGGGIAAVLYQSYAATLIGYVLWGRLLSQHPVGLVAPLTLLVPVIGLISAAILLNEHLSTTQWLGAAIVMFALIVNVFGRRFR